MREKMGVPGLASQASTYGAPTPPYSWCGVGARAQNLVFPSTADIEQSKIHCETLTILNVSSIPWPKGPDFGK